MSEPLEHGADIMAGSLIKNAGGGIAPTGGYVAGKESLVEDVAYELTAPGLGDHMVPIRRAIACSSKAYSWHLMLCCRP